MNRFPVGCRFIVFALVLPVFMLGCSNSEEKAREEGRKEGRKEAIKEAVKEGVKEAIKELGQEVQMESSSDDARLSAVKTDLSTIRTQLMLYRVNHNNTIPTSWAQMMKYTDQQGATADAADSTHVYGPYLESLPINQFNNQKTIKIGTEYNPKDNSSGWYYDSSIGKFWANCPNKVGSTVVGDL